MDKLAVIETPATIPKLFKCRVSAKCEAHTSEDNLKKHYRAAHTLAELEAHDLLKVLQPACNLNGETKQQAK